MGPWIQTCSENREGPQGAMGQPYGEGTSVPSRFRPLLLTNPALVGLAVVAFGGFRETWT